MLRQLAAEDHRSGDEAGIHIEAHLHGIPAPGKAAPVFNGGSGRGTSVAVAPSAGVGVADPGVPLTVGSIEPVGVGVAVGPGVSLGLGVSVSAGVSVSVGVSVTVGVTVGVGVTEGVGVSVGSPNSISPETLIP
jgi:hypothetical protein